jgi:hypothetical protein
MLTRCYDLHIIHIPAETNSHHDCKSCYDSVRITASVSSGVGEGSQDGEGESREEEVFYSADAQSSRNVHNMATSLAEEMARDVDMAFKSLGRPSKHRTHGEDAGTKHDAHHQEEGKQSSESRSTRAPHQEHVFLHHDDPAVQRDLGHHGMEPVTHHQLLRTSSQDEAPELTVIIGPYK